MAAKIGDNIVHGVPIDSVFYVAPAAAYTTVAQRTSYYIPLVPVKQFLDKASLEELVAKEHARRKEASEQKAKDAERRAKDKEEERFQSQVKKFQRTFSDATGNHKVEAIIVGVTDDAVTLVRVSDKKELAIPLERLSSEDQQWISENRFWIQRAGPKLLTRLRE